MELKGLTTVEPSLPLTCFNRTFMELKGTNIINGSIARVKVLIVPLWN